jgi:hypothetical protein
MGEAARWFGIAAEQGHARAQCRLSMCYSRGEGVPVNYGQFVSVRHHYCHICARTGLAPSPSAQGLGASLPHPRRDWAHPCHIGAGTAWARLSADAAPMLGSCVPPAARLRGGAFLRKGAQCSRRHARRPGSESEWKRVGV